MAFGEDALQCQGNLLRRPESAHEVAHHLEQDAARLQFGRRSATDAPLLGTGSRRGAGVARGVGIAPELSADGAG